MTSRFRSETPRLTLIAVTLMSIAIVAPSYAGESPRGYTAYYGWANGGTGAYYRPDGSYASYGDFIQELDGVPCDVKCRGWGNAPGRD
jgi:hypothetical protein